METSIKIKQADSSNITLNITESQKDKAVDNNLIHYNGREWLFFESDRQAINDLIAADKIDQLKSKGLDTEIVNELVNILIFGKGFSVNILTGELLNAGSPYYLVSKEGFERRFIFNKGNGKVIKSQLLAFIYDNFEQLLIKGNYFGAWVHEGYLYLDISEAIHQRYKTLSTVKSIAKSRGQKAVWDCLNNREIFI